MDSSKILWNFSSIGDSDFCERWGNRLTSPLTHGFGRRVSFVHGEMTPTRQGNRKLLSIIGTVSAIALYYLTGPTAILITLGILLATTGVILKACSKTHAQKVHEWNKPAKENIQEQLASARDQLQKSRHDTEKATLASQKMVLSTRLNAAGEKIYRVDVPAPGIKGLTLSGGGTKGIAYAGAIKAMTEAGIIDYLERVTGSSAGAMAALMISIGVPDDRCEEIVKTTDSQNLLAFGEAGGNGSRGLRDNGNLMKDFLASIEREQVAKYLAGNFLIAEDEYEGDGEYVTILNRLNGFVNNEVEFTFSDARNLRLLLKDEHKHLIKDLYIPIFNSDTRQLDIYSFETTPYFSRAKAAQISGAHPIPFQPSLNEKGEELIDAGVLDNLPSHILEKYEPRNRLGVLSEKGDFTTTNLNLVFGKAAHKAKRCKMRSALYTHKELSPSDPQDIASVQMAELGRNFLGGQNFRLNKYRLYQRIRKRSSRTVLIDPKKIKTLDGLLPVSKKPSDESMNECIEHTELKLLQYFNNRGLYGSFTTERLYYDYDSPLEMLMEFNDEELQAVISGEVHLEGEDLSAFAGELLDLRRHSIDTLRNRASKEDAFFDRLLRQFKTEELAIRFLKNLVREHGIVIPVESNEIPILKKMGLLDKIDKILESIEEHTFEINVTYLSNRRKGLEEAAQFLEWVTEQRRRILLNDFEPATPPFFNPIERSHILYPAMTAWNQLFPVNDAGSSSGE